MRSWLHLSTPRADGRLSALDVSNLRVEEHGMPMHVAALVLLDAAPLLDASGDLRLDRLGDHVELRTASWPRLRQVLVPPVRRFGPWHWVEHGDVAIEDHVRAAEVPAPADETALASPVLRAERAGTGPVTAAVGDVARHRARRRACGAAGARAPRGG